MKTFRNLLLEMAAKNTKKSESVVASVVPVPSKDQGKGVQRHYEHAGDVHFNDGKNGASTMADMLSEIIDSAPEHLATKIDGSPSMEYGIEDGRHYISYKGSGKKSFTHEDIEAHHGSGPQGFKDAMHAMLDHVDKIHNGNPEEVHQGDIMWHGKNPHTIENIDGVPHYTFRPNVLRNAIPVDSEEGERIKNATFGFAPHTAYVGGVSRNFSHSEEKQHPDVHLFDAQSPSIPEEKKQTLQKQVSDLKNSIRSTPEEHFSYISQNHIADLFKRYTSEIRRTESQDNIGFGHFISFVHGKLQKGIDDLKSPTGKQKKEQSRNDLLTDMKTNRDHIQSGLDIHKAITNIGNNIRSVLDSEQTTKRYFDASTGRDRTNPEGYVFKPLGTLKHAWYKLVDPRFTAKNFAVMRGPKTEPIKESQENVPGTGSSDSTSTLVSDLKRTGSSDSAVLSFGRGMGHAGHMALASSVITHAGENRADPYVVLSKTTGPKDPLTVDEKIAIHHDVFPEHNKVFQPATDGMPTIIEVLQQLHGHGYKNVTVVLGEDQHKEFQFIHKYNGQFDPETGKGYKFDDLNLISRQETNDSSRYFKGPRATDMRNALTDGTKSEDEQWKIWREAMHPSLSNDRVRNLMEIVKERLSKNKSNKSTKMESIINNMLSYIFEEGEASSGQMTSDGAGIAGLGDDARAGNVIVRKKPRMFKRRQR